MATDFFERQDRARRNTGWLIVLFVLAVAAIIASVYAATALLVEFARDDKEHAIRLASGQIPFWNPALFGGVAASTLFVVASGSLYKIAQLSAGGRVVAIELGGRPIDPSTRDPDERRLLNVVEEMAIAAGTPVPPVYLLPEESSINAFAAGFEPKDAVIGVAAGSLEYLTRDELQGVIAHEFSHILNGDMRLNIRLIGLLNGILILSLLGYQLIRMVSHSRPRRSSSSRDGKDGRLPILLFGLALLLIGWVGVFFGRLIKAGVSRQREYLADASAVQFTRNPDGIAGALKKIGGLAAGSRIKNANAEEASHLFFGNGVPVLFQWFATHPPLPDRIRAIDPYWDGVFPEVRPLRELGAGAAEAPRGPRTPFPFPIPGRAAAVGLADAAPPLTANRATRAPTDPASRVGSPMPEHAAEATRVLSAIPVDVLEAAREPFSARAVVLCLLLDRSSEVVRDQQKKLLEVKLDPALLRDARRLAGPIVSLPEELRLPLASYSIPALKNLSPAQYRDFRALVDLLTSADKQINLFEYALKRMLIRNLDADFGMSARTRMKYASLRPLLPRVAGLLGALSYAGATDDAAASAAFAKGWSELGAGPAPDLPTPSEANLRAVDQALTDLAAAAPGIKRRVLNAAVACVGHDHGLTIREAELLRAIADGLDCPVPPLLEEAPPAGGPSSAPSGRALGS